MAIGRSWRATIGMLILAGFAWSSNAAPAPVNLLSAKPIAPDAIRVQLRIAQAEALSADGSRFDIDCTIPDTVRLDESADGLPGFSRVLEVEQGRFADVQIESAIMDELYDGPSGIEPTTAAPVSVTVGRMAGRVFLRIEARPFRVQADGSLNVYREIDATVRLSNRSPELAAVPEPAPSLQSVTDPLCLDCPARMSIDIPAGNGQPGDFAARRSVTSDVAWKISITQPGLYRITGAQLTAAGLPVSYLNSTNLRLSVRDQTVPVWTSATGPMTTNDWIQFYGAGVQSIYTTQNVYWLSVEGAGSSFPTYNAATNSGALLATSFWHTVNYSPRRLFRASYRPEANLENWFAMYVQATTASNISFSTPAATAQNQVRLSYVLHGYLDLTGTANPDHRSDLLVGGVLATSIFYAGETKISGTSTVAVVISNANSSVQLSQIVPSGIPPILGANSGAFVESLRLSYQRQLTFTNFPYYFSGPTNAANLRISGITSTNFWLLDVTDPAAPSLLTNTTVISVSGTGTVWFGHPAGAIRCYGLFGTGSVQNVPGVELVRFRGLSATNRSPDYLLIGADSFRRPLYRLLKHRFKNGLSVQAASPQDVFNEFGYGVKDPTAVRQYLGFAYHHYVNPPTYAVLAGNGTYDPLNNLGQNERDDIPAVLGWSAKFRTSIDQWYAMVDGGTNDTLPDIQIGRISATTLTNMENAVSKLVSYETSSPTSDWFHVAMLVADYYDGVNDFDGFTDANTFVHLTNANFDASFGIIKNYVGTGPIGNIRSAISNELLAGLQIVNYMGHGSVDRWSSSNAWSSASANAINNSVYPIFTIFSCNNGTFEDATNTLAEAIVLSKGSGSACLAPSVLADQVYSEKLADGFYSAFASNQVTRIGDALSEGFLRLWSYNPAARELFFYTLFGDPAQAVWGGAKP